MKIITLEQQTDALQRVHADIRERCEELLEIVKNSGQDAIRIQLSRYRAHLAINVIDGKVAIQYSTGDDFSFYSQTQETKQGGRNSTSEIQQKLIEGRKEILDVIKDSNRVLRRALSKVLPNQEIKAARMRLAARVMAYVVIPVIFIGFVATAAYLSGVKVVYDNNQITISRDIAPEKP